jgi:hypothetical protein
VKRVRRALRRVATVFAFLFLAFLLAVMLTDRSGDPAILPATGDDAVLVHFVSHGYHWGLVLPRAALANEAGRRGHSAVVSKARSHRRSAGSPFCSAKKGMVTRPAT